MKILIVFNHPAPYKVALFNGLNEHHDVHVIFERFSEKNRNKAFYNEQSYDFTLHEINGIKLGNFNHLSLGVRRHLRHNKYDLIIMNGYSTFTEMIALRYLKHKKIPYVFYINGGIVKKEPKFVYRFKRYFIGGAKAYLSPAPKANEYLRHYGVPTKKIYNYPYSTVYERDVLLGKSPRANKITFWKNHDIRAENFTICITSFIKRKNNETIIKAWKDIPRENALILVGEGKCEKKYKKIIAKLELENVFLLPFAPKAVVKEYLKYADNAVYLSNYDIYGHVINEALANGLNVLTNKNMVAAHELISHDENGLFATDDIHGSIRELLTKDFFWQATNSAVTIEDSVKVHLKILEKIA